MAIFLRHNYNVKPPRWGSPADVQYAIKINTENVYDRDPDNDILTIPLFWGLPLVDYSGRNNNGTNNGATYKDGSLSFDGVDDYVLGGTSWDLSSGTFTVGGWIKADAFAAADGQYNAAMGFWIDADLDEFIGFCVTKESGVPYWKIFSQGETPGRDDTAISTGIWHHIYLVWDGTDFNLYRNGQFGYSVTPTGSGWKTVTSFLIGDELNRGVGNTNFWDGLIDEARISNIDYTSDQIALQYELPWALYQPVSRPIYSIPAPPAGAIMNQFQGVNLGADLFNGALL